MLRMVNIHLHDEFPLIGPGRRAFVEVRGNRSKRTHLLHLPTLQVVTMRIADLERAAALGQVQEITFDAGRTLARLRQRMKLYDGLALRYRRTIFAEVADRLDEQVVGTARVRTRSRPAPGVPAGTQAPVQPVATPV